MSSSTSTSSMRSSMGSPEPELDVNFPELLIQDLEESEPVFASKCMTSGYPSRGLATVHAAAHAEEDDDYSSQGPDIPRYKTSQFQRPAMGTFRTQSFAAKSERILSVDMQGGDERIKDEFSDSATESSVEIEPPSVRTREQSVTTAPTSISGRCSSLLSHKPPSPSSISSPHLNQIRQGTWFDAEEEDFQPEPEVCHNLDKTSPPLRPHSALGHNGVNVADICTPPSSLANEPSISAMYVFPSDFNNVYQRPNTSTGQHLQLERPKPRIIDIHSSIVPQRKSSLRGGHVRMMSSTSIAYTATSQEPTAKGFPTNDNDMDMMDQDETTLYNSPSPPDIRLATLSPPFGRPAMNASRSPSLDLAGQDRGCHRANSAPYHQVNFAAENDAFEDEEPPGAEVYPERPTLFRKASESLVQSWLDSSADINGLQTASRDAPSLSLAGPPLPPNVIETLRISITNFPDTMLLTSSLTIETIRSYSRKLRRQVSTDGHWNGEDDQSVFSFSAYSNKPQKRWKLPKLMQSRRSKPPNINTCGGGLVPNSATAPNILQPLSSPVPGVHWTPMRNIFPAGSDYLCDALYAHLIAYNYMSELCPLPPVPIAGTMTATTARGGGGSSGMRAAPPPPSSAKENARHVPKKALRVLGMHTTAAAEQNVTDTINSKWSRGGGGGRRHQQNGFGTGDAERGSIKSHGSCGNNNNNSSRNNDMKVLRNLQAGLGRCITMLVKTLKLGRSVDECRQQIMASPDEAEKAEPLLDPLLLRALCEVVRCAEEQR
ncbi:hypothetical protein B0T17DRAFT_614138 [Bombardia bombarda]|uniref:Uncharacterized protein n=1 Tax=Bombardia bombarda TaxID=252184 RepID=A0AA39X7H7_9PEZI|nr:hypothetical protein B0T17DRAFT_614138 [Bombardia bombarda]